MKHSLQPETLTIVDEQLQSGASSVAKQKHGPRKRVTVKAVAARARRAYQCLCGNLRGRKQACWKVVGEVGSWFRSEEKLSTRLRVGPG